MTRVQTSHIFNIRSEVTDSLEWISGPLDSNVELIRHLYNLGPLAEHGVTDLGQY